MFAWLLLLFFIAVGMSLVTYGLRRRYYLRYGLADPLATPASSSMRQPAARPPRPVQPDSPLPDVVTLAQLAAADNLFVVGPKGSGKTTTIRCLLALRTGDHIALDPHNAPDKWACPAIGGGLDYAAINRYLQALWREVQTRYDQVHTGTAREGRFHHLTTVADEWREIAQELPDLRPRNDRPAQPGAARVMKRVITQGRKIGVCFIGATHIDTAAGTGLVGESELIDCYDWVIYLGGSAVRRLPLAARMTRPAIAYCPERRAYALLDLRMPAAAPAPRALTTAALALVALAQVPNRHDDVNGAEPQQNAAEPDEAMVQNHRLSPVRNQDEVANEHESNVVLTTDELRHLGRALHRYHQTGSKVRAIEEAFAVTKGGGAKYLRAKALFEAAVADEVME